MVLCLELAGARRRPRRCCCVLVPCGSGRVVFSALVCPACQGPGFLFSGITVGGRVRLSWFVCFLLLACLLLLPSCKPGRWTGLVRPFGEGRRVGLSICVEDLFVFVCSEKASCWKSKRKLRVCTRRWTRCTSVSLCEPCSNDAFLNVVSRRSQQCLVRFQNGSDDGGYDDRHHHPAGMRKQRCDCFRKRQSMYLHVPIGYNWLSQLSHLYKRGEGGQFRFWDHRKACP